MQMLFNSSFKPLKENIARQPDPYRAIENHRNMTPYFDFIIFNQTLSSDHKKQIWENVPIPAKWRCDIYVYLFLALLASLLLNFI